MRWHAASSYKVSGTPMPYRWRLENFTQSLATNAPLLACLRTTYRSFQHPLRQSRPGFRHGQGALTSPVSTSGPQRVTQFAFTLQLDVAVLVLLLLNVLSKGPRPPAWLFWTMPLPSLTFAAVNTACLLLALLSSSW